MKHTLEEIEEMLNEMNWIDEYLFFKEIISDLIEEVKKLTEEKHKSELTHYTDGYRHAEAQFRKE